MSTFLFEITSSTVVRVQKNGFSTYKPRHMSAAVSGDKILFQTNIDVGYDFCVLATDEVIFQAQYVTGTAQEIADYLTENIFNVSPDAVDGAAMLSEENTFSENQSIIKNQVGTTQLTIVNSTPGGSGYFEIDSASTGAYAGANDETNKAFIGTFTANAFIEITANGPDNTDDPDTAVIAAGGGHLLVKINNVIELIIPSTGIGNYADDAAAEAGGVPVKGAYHTNGTLKMRLV